MQMVLLIAYVRLGSVCRISLFPSGAFNPMLDEPQPGHRKTQLILKIISGQQLPKPRDSMLGDRGEVRATYWGWSNPHTPGKLIKMWPLLMFLCFQIIDPFVEVEIIGLPLDCSKQQTRVVDDNGLCTCSYCNAHQNNKIKKNLLPITSSLMWFRFQSYVGGDPRFQHSNATDRPGAVPCVGSQSYWTRIHWPEDYCFHQHDAR